MSGSGRKSGYRKSVTEAYENSYPVPNKEEEECIVKVKGSRGTNIFEIELNANTIELARLPNKFKKLIWIKRNDYLIVSYMNHQKSTDESSSAAEVETPVTVLLNANSNLAFDESKVQYEIKHILNKDQIKHLKAQLLWPEHFISEEDNKKKMSSDSYGDDLMPDYQEDYLLEEEEDEEAEGDGGDVGV